MLPQFLQSSYAQYKADTNVFASWLLQTANQCGYQPPGLAAAPAAPPVKKGKRNRKKHETVTTSDPDKYTATIKDLQTLAEVVASSTVTIPKSVLTIAKRAIKLRKTVTSWFLGQGDSDDNQGHAYFITALESICKTLESKKDKESNADAIQSPPATEADGDNADTDRFLNKFAVLTVEEPQDSTQTEPTAVESQKIVKVTVSVTEENEDELSDDYLGHLFFKILCLLSDMKNIRAFISSTWSEYRDKKIDLMNASIVTDSALQIAQDLVEDVLDDLRASADWPSDDIQKMVFNLATLVRGITDGPSDEIGLPYNKDLADVAEWVYLPTKILLDSFADVLRVNPLPVFKPGYYGIYNPKANRERMSLGQKFDEDKKILLRLLPEFCMLKHFRIEMPTDDVITRGLVEFCKTKNATFWLCFASQVFLDIHHIMRHSALGAFDDLRMSGLRIQRTIEDYLKLSETHPQPKFWPKEGDDEIRHISSTVKSWIVQDLFLDIRNRSRTQRGLPRPEKHALFSQHPILCGLILFHLNMRMQFVGQQLVSQWYDVQQLAFLHNLVIQSPMHKDVSWPDMDVFIKIHGESHIFVGSRPKNASESLNRLELATGILSATNFARNSRSRRFHKPDGKTSRVLTPTTAVANLLRATYGAGLEEDAGIRNIDRVLDELSRKSDLETSSTSSKELQRSNPELMVARKWSNTHNIGTMQLLAFLKTKLFEEEPVILYNYFGMHKRSMELLRLIQAEEHRKFVQYFTAAYMPDASMISNIVILIHHVAAGSAQNARTLGFSSPGTPIASRIVTSAGDIMRQYLQKNGDVACKELRVFCKNKKPIQDDVAYDRSKSDELVYSWFGIEDIVGPKAVASLQTGIPIS